jgi:2-polyprenyl-6-methoxyphenol hydroxylase-like FAD-dependent oxidoreductase
VHLADNSSYEGDIIVGADGAYSAIRQRLYEKLKDRGELPKSDQEDLPFNCTCLVGQTKVLDPEDYPIVKEKLCQFLIVLGEKDPFTVSA